MSQPFIIEHRDKCGALFKVFLALLNCQSFGGDNHLVDKEGFGDRETNGDILKQSGLGEIDQNSDERKRQRVDIPLPDGQGSDLFSSRAMGDKFDLIATRRKFLHSFGGNEIYKTEIGD